MHIGRRWVGHQIEDDCPCGKAPCGLVDDKLIDPDCVEHNPLNAKTIRQVHSEADCRTSRRHTLDECPNPKTWTVLDDAPDLGLVAGETQKYCPCYMTQDRLAREATDLVLEEWREGGWNDDY